MFAYNQRPVSKLRTSLDIERFGQQALLRALNIGRVVALVGSGTSLKFGQPTWRDFGERAAKLFFEMENALLLDDQWKNKNGPKTEFRLEFELELSPLVREIKELYAAGAALDASYFIELCEDYFREVTELLTRHKIEPGRIKNQNMAITSTRRIRTLKSNWKKDNDAIKDNAKPHKPQHWATAQFGPGITEDDAIKDIVQNHAEFRREYAKQYEGLVDNQKGLRGAPDLKDLLARRSNGSGIKENTWRRLKKLCKDADPDTKDITSIDAARALRTELGVRRFLTLNYDLELERMLFEEGRATPSDSHAFFDIFLKSRDYSMTARTDYEIGRAVSLTSPSGRVLRSTSSRAETLADLFSFGAFPTNYDASVHHLHGRLDDPANMITTPKDYQRVYFGESEQKRSFDEARHAVFTGSDLFVLGMGTSESAVLKPLRDFLEIGEERRDSFGKVYYVTTSNLGKMDNLREAFTDARRKNMARTQEVFKDYGMHTLFIDHSFDMETSTGWTNQRANLFAARAEVTYYHEKMRNFKNAGNGEKISPWDEQELRDDFDAVFGDVGKPPSDTVITGPTEKDLLTLDEQPRTEIALARMLVTAWNDADETERKAIKATMEAVSGRLVDAGLYDYVCSLKKLLEDWWRDWSTLPGMRLAVFGPHYYKVADDSDTPNFALVAKKESDWPIVWRQTNLVTEFPPLFKLGDRKETPQFSDLISITAKAKLGAQLCPQNTDCSQYPAAVARISIPPGGGKGRLVSFFTSCHNFPGGKSAKDWPFQALFNPSLTEPDSDSVLNAIRKESPPYKACFTAHLTFVLEFSSCIIGLTRLIQQVLPELREESSDKGDPRWKTFESHAFHATSGVDPCIKTLSEMFGLFKDTCPAGGWETRILAVFSVLDRLVDDKGDAHSSIHRAFFRLISGWDKDRHGALPIDTVLINSYAERPIRYLSEEENLTLDGSEDRRASPWSDASWLVRRERGVALKHWTELSRVRPRMVFREALTHAAKASLLAATGIGADSKTDAAMREKEIFAWIYGEQTPDRSADVEFMELPKSLMSLMNRRVANGHFFAGLANAVWEKTQMSTDHKAEFRKEWKRHISALDIAYTRERTRGFLDELLSVYRRLDRPDVLDPKKVSKFHRRPTTSIEQCRERLRTMIVDHLALFNHPVSLTTIMVCPDVADVLKEESLRSFNREQLVQKDLDALVARGLASRYVKYAALRNQAWQTSSAGDYVYALDTRLAGALRARSSLEVFSNYRLASFQPSLYPSQPEQALKPEVAHFERVSAVVRALVKTSHDRLLIKHWSESVTKDVKSFNKRAFAAEMEIYSDRLRSAYALIRATFSISVIARLSETTETGFSRLPFDEYRTWTRKLLNCATLFGNLFHQYREAEYEQFDEFSESVDAAENGNANQDDHHLVYAYNADLIDRAIPFNQPFLRDEISWLYNERGLVSFFQGRLFDAMPLFEQSRTVLCASINRSDPPSYKATHRRVQLNHVLAQMERGNISPARATLESILFETQPRWRGDTPSVLHCMATGYLALCHHLTNEFSRAEVGYKTVLANIGQFNHPRAECIFHRHYADLLRSMAKTRNDAEFKGAISHLRLAEELALGIRATDLHNYALIAEARLNRDMQNRGLALERLRRVEDFARRMGVQKMLAEVLKVRGEVLLAEGETVQAGQVTSQSIAISKRNGMRLRKISAAVIQAKVLEARGQTVDSQRLLREIIVESQVLGYATKTSQAVYLMGIP